MTKRGKNHNNVIWAFQQTLVLHNEILNSRFLSIEWKWICLQDDYTVDSQVNKKRRRNRHHRSNFGIGFPDKIWIEISNPSTKLWLCCNRNYIYKFWSLQISAVRNGRAKYKAASSWFPLFGPLRILSMCSFAWLHNSSGWIQRSEIGEKIHVWRHSESILSAFFYIEFSSKFCCFSYELKLFLMKRKEEVRGRSQKNPSGPNPIGNRHPPSIHGWTFVRFSFVKMKNVKI